MKQTAVEWLFDKIKEIDQLLLLRSPAPDTKILRNTIKRNRELVSRPETPTNRRPRNGVSYGQ